MITTKRGDGGWTDFEGKRVKKDSRVIEAIGTIDELQAVLGGLDLEDIQEDLYQIMAGKFEMRRIDYLEREIGKLERGMEIKRNFVIFKKTGAIYLNWVRTVARRAERRAVVLRDKEALVYLNRLSDYLYLLALKEEQKN